MIRTLQTTFCSLVFVFCLASCKDRNPLEIPVPESPVHVPIERLDSAWFNASAITWREDHPQWQAKYGELYTRYVEDVLHIGNVQDSNLFDEVRSFTTDPTMLEIQETINEVFPTLAVQQEEIENAWKYYSYYFPGRRIPQHVAFNGGFNTPAVLTENGVGIGLEMYLGADCVFYDYLQYPVYLRSRMRPESLAPTVMKGWLDSEFELDNPTPTLVETIIHKGKLLYCMDALFPSTSDALKIFYTEEQVLWAQQHERFVWAHFIDNELLFTTDQTEIAKYCNDGPFTVDLVKESPPRMGEFIGWQIVRAYMEDQPVIDLNKLMQTEAEAILNQSKYKP